MKFAACQRNTPEEWKHDLRIRAALRQTPLARPRFTLCMFINFLADLGALVPSAQLLQGT
jgi:hypothetical protein